MRTPFLLGSCVLVAVAVAVSAGSINAGCVTTTTPVASSSNVGTGGVGGAASLLMPGEICTDPTSDNLALRFYTPTGSLQEGVSGGTSPTGTPIPAGALLTPTVFLTPCAAGQLGCALQQVKLTVDPDTCVPSDVEFTTGNAAIAPVPENTTVGLHRDTIQIPIQAGPSTGSTAITAVVYAASQTPTSCQTNADCAATSFPTCHNSACTLTATSSFNVEVLPPNEPSCTGTASTPSLAGGDPPLTLGAASIVLPAGAANPDAGSFLWGVTPFPATLACSAATPPSGYVALGPAVTFGPTTQVFQREVPLAIPLNPALMPSTAYLRHLRVAYSGPAFLAPRVIPVADAHITSVTVNGAVQWALSFKAPKLGTYQAVIAPDAGTNTFQRTMTHRAIVGISMGGGGTATFGMRHHNLFDALAPLGGPVDWTWMLDYIATNNLGGFRPIAPGTTLSQIQINSTSCQTNADCKSDETCLGVLTSPAMAGQCVLMPVVTDPYEHPETFNNWWYEYPRSGNGGTFDRSSYAQIFRDLALMYGNPNGWNLSPSAENLPAGVPPTSKAVVGNHPGNECAVTVNPICPTNPDGSTPDTCPQLAVEQELVTDCPVERCMNTLTLNDYFDAKYNPDGAFPVITVCDGSPQNQLLTPYSNTWTSTGNNYPLEVALAVDYNGNGVRDELEPVLAQGHEPWDDFGTDGIPSPMEPGYMPGVNEDPNGDDYNAQYNPSGTENDHRFQTGEKFYDLGLDGVANTPQQPATGWAKPGDGYDVGEGDGTFTVAAGLQRFWDRDPHGIVRQMVDPAQIPGGELTDAALARIDVWTDGGLRDLFNFGVDAQHLVGTFAARNRLTSYLTAFTQAPGLDPSLPPDGYDGKLVDFSALPGVVLQRYGEIDPTANDIADGSGQHVGSADEIVARLESALYFIGSRWKDRTELFIRVDTSIPPLPNCQEGSSTILFPPAMSPLGPSMRRGPVGISLPPGYCSSKLTNIRYPVIYVLHGYGQTPQDLEPTIVLLQNFMNDANVSVQNRLVKAIIVYVDGRCRTDADGTTAECLEGTFFADSPRPTSALDESWWLELMTYMDQNYRTLSSSTTVPWTE